jgi:hypothetical protein
MLQKYRFLEAGWYGGRVISVKRNFYLEVKTLEEGFKYFWGFFLNLIVIV